MLGQREPDKYGSQSLEDIVSRVVADGEKMGLTVEHVQSNAEHVLIDAIHAAKDVYDGIIINPAAFTHTSVALRDALLSVSIPFIEVHLSNVHAREPFRQHSYLSDIAIGVICGFGANGYCLSLIALNDYLKQQS